MLIFTKYATVVHNFIDQGGFSVVNVGYNGDVFDFHNNAPYFLEGAKVVFLRKSEIQHPIYFIEKVTELFENEVSLIQN